MSTSLWATDLAAFSLQVGIIVGAGAMVWRVLGVRHAAVTLFYWRALLLACLLLPLSQPWRSPAPAAFEAGRVQHSGGALAVGVSPTDSAEIRSSWSAEDALLLLLTAGVLVRSLWLVIAVCSLRRLRRTAVRIDPLPSPIRTAEERAGASAEFCLSDRVAGPITFGFRRPVVIFPPRVLSMTPDVQDAIATHELLHVRRRDWLHVIAEEVIRTVLWFHPAIWWLVARIQLTREHVVDHRVVELTQSRDGYVEALLAVATTGKPVALVPASLFLRRRFLKRRLAHILQETTMTTRRLIASVTVSAGALAVAAILAVRTFPLEARAPQQESRGWATTDERVQILKGGEHLLHGALPEYPRRAIQQRIEGDVDLEVSVDERGEVVDARVLSGRDELRRAALQAVLQWHYSPESLRSTSTQVSLRFHAPAAGAELEQQPEPQKFETSPASRLERQLMELANALRDPGTSESQKAEFRQKYAEAQERLKQIRAGAGEAQQEAGVEATARLVQIRSERVPQEVLKEIRERAGISLGDSITEATAKRIRDIARSVDEHLRVSFERDGRGGVILLIIAP
jgi:TonB family protein